MVRYFLALPLLLGVLWWLFTGENALEYRFYRFDSGDWKAARPEERYYMARYLIDHGKLVGKTRAEVDEMLGPSELGSGNVVFNLGPEHDSLFRVDDDWLWVEFSNVSPEAVVTTAVIRVD